MGDTKKVLFKNPIMAACTVFMIWIIDGVTGYCGIGGGSNPPWYWESFLEAVPAGLFMVPIAFLAVVCFEFVRNKIKRQ